MSNHLGGSALIYTHVWFRETRDGTVAVVNSYSRRQPTWVRYRDKDLGRDVEEFWIRVGNSNERLAASAAHNYIALGRVTAIVVLEPCGVASGCQPASSTTKASVTVPSLACPD